MIELSVRNAKGSLSGCPFCVDKTLALHRDFLLNEVATFYAF